MKIRGNTVGVSNPRPDWDQKDTSKSNYVENKPELLPAPVAAKVGDLLQVSAIQNGKVTATEAVTIAIEEVEV